VTKGWSKAIWDDDRALKRWEMVTEGDEKVTNWRLRKTEVNADQRVI